LGLLKHKFVEVAPRRIKEIVLLIVEEAVLWSDLNKPMERQRITRIKSQTEEAFRTLKAELQTDTGPLHWDNFGNRNVSWIAEDGRKVAEQRNSLEIGLRLFIGQKCFEILASSQLTPKRLVQPTAEDIAFFEESPHTFLKGSPYYTGHFHWKLRHFPMERKLGSILRQKEKLQNRIARLLHSDNRFARKDYKTSEMERDEELARRQKIWKET